MPVPARCTFAPAMRPSGPVGVAGSTSTPSPLRFSPRAAVTPALQQTCLASWMEDMSGSATVLRHDAILAGIRVAGMEPDRSTIWPYEARRAGRLLLLPLRAPGRRRRRAGARRARGRRRAALFVRDGRDHDASSSRSRGRAPRSRWRRAPTSAPRGSSTSWSAGASATSSTTSSALRPRRTSSGSRRRRIRLLTMPDFAAATATRRADGLRRDRRDARLPPPAGPRRRLRRPQRDEVPRRPPQRAARRDDHAGRGADGAAPRLPRQHGADRRTGRGCRALGGLETLDVRVERQTETATELARRLEAHPAVGIVRYPGFGGLISFDVAARRRGPPRRDVHPPDRERHEPRRRRLDDGVAAPLGGRPGARGTAAALGRARGRRRALGRPRTGPGQI